MDKQIHGRQEIENRFLATVACKAAIKGNKELTDMEIKSLLDGRPTAIKISLYDLERKFSRK